MIDDLDIKQLPKDLEAECKKAGVTKVEVSLSGGSDEAYHAVSTDPEVESHLYRKLREWAEEAYPFSGSGGGVDYGTNIVYDLQARTITSTDWAYAIREEEPERVEMPASNEE